MHKIYNDLEILDTEVGIDWLTITANTEEVRNALLKRFLKLKEAMILLGELPESWMFHGYQGLKIGHARWGSRLDSDILILSGQDALCFWRIFAPLSSNCSRIDLAVTAKTRKCYPRLLYLYAAQLNASGSKTAKRAVHLERVDGTGKTLYVASRSSGQFGRIYDKGAEMNLPLETHRLWRYEVEFKKDLANRVLRQLLHPESGPAFPQNIRSTVHKWFVKRDIYPVFDDDGTEPLGLDLHATITSSSQKLAWLSSQVRPTVARLRAAGFEDSVYAALGLD